MKMRTETYDTYMTFQRELITLFKENKGESEEADKIRDKMDPIWRLMNNDERGLADNHANQELKDI